MLNKQEKKKSSEKITGEWNINAIEQIYRLIESSKFISYLAITFIRKFCLSQLHETHHDDH